MKGAIKIRRDLDLKHWRKVLPGVPDDEIVLPRYHAKSHPFPEAQYHGSGFDDEDRQLAWTIHLAVSIGEVDRGKGRNPLVRKWASLYLRRALKWWRTVRPLTAPEMNRRLYTHRDGWKNIEDVQEFYICYTLCIVALSLPPRRRKHEAIAAIIKRWVQREVTRYENDSRYFWPTEREDLEFVPVTPVKRKPG